MRRAQQLLVEHFATNAATFRAVSGLSQTREGYLAGVKTMADVIEQVLAEHPARPAQLRTDAISRYIAGAAYGLIDAWLTEEIALSEEQLVEHLVALLPPWFSGHEVSGVVAEIGPVVTELAVGDHVVGCLVQSCGKCEPCLTVRTYQCMRPEETLREADAAPGVTAGGIGAERDQRRSSRSPRST